VRSLLRWKTGDLNGIIAGDFSRDGKIDLAVVGQDNNTVQVLLNQRLQAVAAQSFSGVLASFTDANPFATAGDFTATIDWGNGQITQVGPEGFTANAQGGFDVYHTAGTYTVGITIFDDGGSSTTATNTLYVAAV
jgi:hypothetical protein